MGADSWQVVLPPLFASAGIDPGGAFEIVPLTGGVSSDIVRIRLADGRNYCAKRALDQLKVAAEWKAPVARNHYEVAWLTRAAAIVPGAAPRVLAEDRARGIALLEYLAPEDHVLWKAELLAERADPAVPAAVADVLGRIHAATLNDPSVADAFPTDDLFDALRLDPYLRFTAARHPPLEKHILAVLRSTASTKMALVHGDVSPKNILVAKADGHPVLLDAECAWYGDPAFDAAFCLNHLVLKSVHLPAIGAALRQQAADFAAMWLGHFPQPMREATEQRVAALLPCLMLARIDGKSPVEYLSDETRDDIRALSLPLIIEPAHTVAGVLARVG